MIKGDHSLREHVERELEWEPSLNAAAIGVAVTDAVVTLSGQVASYHEKQAAATVVSRIHGVRGLANELVVKPALTEQRTDTDIAYAASERLAWDARIPKDAVHVEVTDGWITLHGTVPWYCQRWASEDLVSHLMGVRGISNQIAVKPPHPQVHEPQLQSLPRRFENSTFTLDVANNSVEVRGSVSSLAEKLAIEAAIWSVPGVTLVEDHLDVRPAT